MAEVIAMTGRRTGRHLSAKRGHVTRVPLTACLLAVALAGMTEIADAEPSRPHIVLVMTDDQGWGQTGYRQHPVLKTPHLDAMAAAGLRFDRFYAGAPVCSPTRATVLTGRTNRRTGVESHGYALRRQERTLAEALQSAGYATAHFGKWHLNGMRGPGVPILAEDTHHPGHFGFDTWLSVTNFFDRDPVMSRQGEFVEFSGDSSEIIVREALNWITPQAASGHRTFTVIWFGTPHSPFRASEDDRAAFAELNEKSQHHYGELVAMDRSIGRLRAGLRAAGIADETLVWFCSDNGGLNGITPPTTGGLRGHKGSVYEGGLRVPGIVEWPEGIPVPRITRFPAVTMDIPHTVADITGLPKDALLRPADGISLRPLFREERTERDAVIPFACLGNTALIDNDLKLIHLGKPDRYELYDLAEDPTESRNILETAPDHAARMRALLEIFRSSLDASIDGADYPAGRVEPGDPQPRFWMDVDAYRPWFDDWKTRPEYRGRLLNR